MEVAIIDVGKPEVFISYRQSGEAESQRVLAFGERLRTAGIKVILDQFLLGEQPAGPSEGWDKWSSDQALQSSNTIIIGSKAWFQCFDKTNPPGTGLGAACEADDIRHRIYKAGGIVETIRVVLFDDEDCEYVSPKLERYHRFHAERDFESIVRWLKGISTVLGASGSLSTPGTADSTFRHNLPIVHRFFGREAELARLSGELNPDTTGWGVLIDGPGGVGKTTLAIRAAEEAGPQYDEVLFVSAKQTGMDPHGLLDESPFAVSSFSQVLDAVARRLQKPEINKAAAGERPRLLIDALTGTRTLLVLDNLETLSAGDQRSLMAFLGYLPRTCKALLTSRRLVTATGRRVLLRELDQAAALQTLADIASDNSTLDSTSEADRIRLVTETDGNPLLLIWTACQVGTGYCTTIDDALAHLRSCPHENDPLEFIFGDTITRFTDEEQRIVATLSYPAEPIPVTAIADISGVDEPTTRRVLKLLTNNSVVVSHRDEEHALVPMAAEYIRNVRPTIVAQIGRQLADRAFRLITTHGFERYECFPSLDMAWPSVRPALAIFHSGDNAKLQRICDALTQFLHFQGRWDDQVSLCEQAEVMATDVGDYDSAARRAFDIGWLHYLRGHPDAVLASADRCASYCATANSDALASSRAVRLRAIAYELKKNFPAAIEAFGEVVRLLRGSSVEGQDIASAVNDLAEAERCNSDLDAAALHFTEALDIAKSVGDQHGVAVYSGNLAELALDRGDWKDAERSARAALVCSEAVSHQESIALNCQRLARALLPCGKADEARSYAVRSVELFAHLDYAADLDDSQRVLAECDAAIAKAVLDCDEPSEEEQ